MFCTLPSHLFNIYLHSNINDVTGSGVYIVNKPERLFPEVGKIVFKNMKISRDLVIFDFC